ncbi:hypothetical protein GE09DRAFT_1228563 [Coniochaeta sp. 2T2.1]|nr:hypothetical protein GE09DRAFT_1228563 [Coniochaeta sp. 2T2.1]
MSVRYPKRKRAVVKYTEPADEIDGLDDVDGGAAKNADDPNDADATDDEHENGSGPRKKAKTKKRVSPKKKASPPRPKPFPFMSLPPELRNKIYKLVLVDPNGVHISSWMSAYRRKARHVSPVNCGPSSSRVSTTILPAEWFRLEKGTPGAPLDYKPRLVPSLLTTCKAVYAEGAGMLWTQKFRFADMTAMYSFLMNLRPETKAMLRHMTVIYWNGTRTHRFMNMPAFHLLAGVTNLDRLVFIEGVANHPFRVARVPGADGDKQRATRTAEKFFKEAFPWLNAMVKERGADSVK